MSRLDDAIADVACILDTLMAYSNIAETGNCNACKNKDCQWKPKPGQLMRYNCPHYKAEEEPYSIESDGTLTVTVPKGTTVSRVFVQEDRT